MAEKHFPTSNTPAGETEDKELRKSVSFTVRQTRTHEQETARREGEAQETEPQEIETPRETPSVVLLIEGGTEPAGPQETKEEVDGYKTAENISITEDKEALELQEANEEEDVDKTASNINITEDKEALELQEANEEEHGDKRASNRSIKEDKEAPELRETNADKDDHKVEQNRKRKHSAIADGDQHKKADEDAKHRKKHRFVYGNYYHYYGYRMLKGSTEDPRLHFFHKDWFEGKDCLDIGCNAGNLTIAIARKFGCKTVQGIDIDQELVRRAYQLLHKTATKSQNVAEVAENTSDKLRRCRDKEATMEGLSSNRLSAELSNEELLRRVTFKTENFIEHMETCARYDTVLCLSLTKWIHLNWGDVGLIRLFAKIRNLLRPGGILVLEPQPWESYKSKRLVSEVTRNNFKEIKLQPEDFRELLLDKIGFHSMEQLTPTVSGAEGFSRPMYLVRT